MGTFAFSRSSNILSPKVFSVSLYVRTANGTEPYDDLLPEIKCHTHSSSIRDASVVLVQHTGNRGAAHISLKDYRLYLYFSSS